MGAIPTLIRRRGTTPFKLSRWALGTQQLVRFRCLASPLAASTLLLALDRLILTPRIQIQPLALQRFCLTPPAQKTRPMEQPRLNLTTVVAPTVLSAPLRSLATSTDSTTALLARARFVKIFTHLETRQLVVARLQIM